MGVAKKVGANLAPKIPQLAPNLSAAFVHQALDKAITGVGRFPSAASAADKHLAENDGDVARAIHDVIEAHVRFAGLQGFLTNLGGLVTMAFTVPTNITGLALVQCRMVAGIAHLRGYDLSDARSRAAILACLLGEDKILKMVKQRALPGTPMELAAAAAYDETLGPLLANEVATELIGRAAGKRLATTVGRRVPVVGGLVGAGTDGYVTWKIGRYVDREFLPRTPKRQPRTRR